MKIIPLDHLSRLLRSKAVAEHDWLPAHLPFDSDEVPTSETRGFEQRSSSRRVQWWKDPQKARNHEKQVVCFSALVAMCLRERCVQTGGLGPDHHLRRCIAADLV